MQLRERLLSTHCLVRDGLKLASDRMTTQYDLRASDVVFEADDCVWFYNPHWKKGKNSKLQSQWEGPYIVLKRKMMTLVGFGSRDPESRRWFMWTG